MAGGDAPAIALAASGVALAWWQKPLFGGLVAGLSLGVKAIAVPLWLLLPAGLIWSTQKVRFALFLFLGLLPGLFFFQDALAPLLRPRPNAGLLGSWWLATEGQFPGIASLPGMGWQAFKQLSFLPTWTGHPFLGALAIWACIRSKDKALWIILLLSMTAMFLTVMPMGESSRIRYLGPASVGITVLTGVALQDRKWAALLFLWPSLAFVSELGQLRSQEEGLNPRPTVPFLGHIDAEPSFEEGGICGGNELREMARQLAQKLPQNSEVAAIRLRDGREQELFWKLRELRPDLVLTSLQSSCCMTQALPTCANRIRTHLRNQRGALVLPLLPESCKTHLASPSELELAIAFGLNPSAGQRFRLQTWPGESSPTSTKNACKAADPAISPL
jgi:hypothetical protein